MIEKEKSHSKDLEDKTLEYNMIKNLHYQNYLSYYIFQNTYEAAHKQRKANLFIFLQIPTIGFALFEFYLALTNYQLGVNIFFIGILAIIVGYLGSYFCLEKKISTDKYLMKLSLNFQKITSLRSEIEMLNTYNIKKKLTESIESKVKTIALFISYLHNAFNSLEFENKSHEKVEKILQRKDENIEMHINKLTDLKNFLQKPEMKQVFKLDSEEEYKKLEFNANLNEMINILKEKKPKEHRK